MTPLCQFSDIRSECIDDLLAQEMRPDHGRGNSAKLLNLIAQVLKSSLWARLMERLVGSDGSNQSLFFVISAAEARISKGWR